MSTPPEFTNEAERVISRFREETAELKQAIEQTRDLIRRLPTRAAGDSPEPPPARE